MLKPPQQQHLRYGDYAGVLISTHEWRANYENVHINNATVKATNMPEVSPLMAQRFY